MIVSLSWSIEGHVLLDVPFNVIYLIDMPGKQGNSPKIPAEGLS